jgi:MFS family permease
MSHAGEKSSLDQHVEKVPMATADLAEAQQLATQWVDGTPEEKRLVRKLDWRILPCTWILYLLGFLDRANVGYVHLLQFIKKLYCALADFIASSNAKTGGMEDDFNLTSSQYSIIVLVFFISYLIFEVPANMILTRVRPSVFLPGLALVWGTFAALMGATQNWTQLAGMRFLLGFAEVSGNTRPIYTDANVVDNCRPVSPQGAPFSSLRGIVGMNLPRALPCCTPLSRLLEQPLAFSRVSLPIIWIMWVVFRGGGGCLFVSRPFRNIQVLTAPDP